MVIALLDEDGRLLLPDKVIFDNIDELNKVH